MESGSGFVTEFEMFTTRLLNSKINNPSLINLKDKRHYQKYLHNMECLITKVIKIITQKEKEVKGNWVSYIPKHI